MALRYWTSICFFGALLILSVSAARNLHDEKSDPATLDAVDTAKTVAHTEVAKTDTDKAEPAKNVDSTDFEVLDDLQSSNTENLMLFRYSYHFV